MHRRTTLLLWLATAAISSPAAEHKLVFAGPAEGSPAAQAASAALDEIVRQGEFLGLRYDLVFTSADSAAKHPDAAAVVIAASPADILAAADALAAASVPVFNVLSGDDGLRARCRDNLFHIAPSDAMIAAAEAQWRKGNPNDSAPAAHAWRPDFVKFAGRELNNRWRKAAGREMTDDDWAVWAAFRLIGDAIAQNPDASPAELISYLRQDMEFDGQKGAYMTFAASGQLLQPLLVVVDGNLAGEAPVRGVAGSDDLASLDPLTCAP
jgi:ABC-type branched-subunit amino acid transport system substrate-binding protein